VSQVVTPLFFICSVEIKTTYYDNNTCTQTKYPSVLPFGIDFSIKDDHLGVRNTHILEELIDGKLSREYYFQTRCFGRVYLTVVSKLFISDQTWNAFMGTFTKDADVEAFIDMMINKQYDSDLLGLIGNNLPKYPDVVGVILMGESIYKS